MPLTPALSNNIALVKNYVDDPGNLYAVWRKGALTGDLETPFIQFIGARTMSYPVMPFKTGELDDYDLIRIMSSSSALSPVMSP